jgi:DNA-binding transcriptional LysR family regulator
VLQDADIERTVIHSVAAGLGVALLPEQVKKLPHERVVFRPLKPAVETESCIAWKRGNPSAALKHYIQIVCEVGRGTR